MKHLKTFEQHSFVEIDETIDQVNLDENGVEQTNEEFFGGKEKKAAKKFYQKHADKMKALKAAESEGGEKLQAIQDELWDLVKTEWKELGSGLNGEQKNLLRKDLETEIKNVDAKDSRSTIQKLGSGMASGRDDN
ncbi:MAG: hypothetical protein SLAVMIC_00472 [uncultured marine phage]|uniref:Uncharacterized protein n=1 Tax=uncultured marine phage TaxID=707152 RepID=A0A8D9CF82_9VIRU|nr:MAG: hypothetical protein SLAVMIC_00472 [uncultured marine phage]